MDEAVIEFEPRFCGPPTSGNGGYVSGRLAAFARGPARVRLRLPPPLGRSLTVERDTHEVRLVDDGAVVAVAAPSSVTVVAPEPPALPVTVAASEHFRGHTDHHFPTCFVCGPLRERGDGLRIFAGPVQGRDMVAAPWEPDGALAEGGVVAAPYVWAALDCPGGFAVWPEDAGSAIVLGEFAVRIDELVPAGEMLRVVGWPLDQDGRKRRAGTALFGSDGRPLAVAEATWLAVPAGQFTGG